MSLSDFEWQQNIQRHGVARPLCDSWVSC